MKIIVALLIILPSIGFSQNIPIDGLWKGYAVQNLHGDEIKYKRQDFITFNDSSILLFQFQEKLSMETGEITLRTEIDTLVIGNKVDQVYQLTHKDKSLSLVIQGANEFQITYPKFVLTFKRITELQKPTVSFKECQDFILGSTLVEIDTITRSIIDNLSQTYQTNGKVKYQEIDSHTNWESEFLITEFEGFVFLKGITSSPIILTDIDSATLKGLKVDYRFEPKVVHLVDPSAIEVSDSKELIAEKPFEIKVDKVSPQECISKLSDAQLNLEVSLAKGITEKQIPTTQVQHAYKCDWMFFHGEGFDGFTKTTVKELLKIDSSLCYIVQIPCGYYAERESLKDDWYIYLHEDRFETDSSFILKKAFRWDNTYRVIHEMKKSNLVHYEDYYLDTRIIKKTWSFLNGEEVGITRLYNIKGELEEEINNDE